MKEISLITIGKITLPVSDFITLCGVLVSLAIGVLSIIIAVCSLKQNSKMIKESTRPYITVYYSTVNNGSVKGLFIIKNFGKTGATITDFEYNPELKNCRWDDPEFIEQFDAVKNMFLAPSQKQILPYYPKEMPTDTCKFKIKYSDGKNSYCDCSNINVDKISGIPKTRNSTKDKELKNISYSLQEISEQIL